MHVKVGSWPLAQDFKFGAECVCYSTSENGFICLMYLYIYTSTCSEHACVIFPCVGVRVRLYQCVSQRKGHYHSITEDLLVKQKLAPARRTYRPDRRHSTALPLTPSPSLGQWPLCHSLSSISTNTDTRFCPLIHPWSVCLSLYRVLICFDPFTTPPSLCATKTRLLVITGQIWRKKKTKKKRENWLGC